MVKRCLLRESYRNAPLPHGIDSVLLAGRHTADALLDQHWPTVLRLQHDLLRHGAIDAHHIALAAH